MKSLTPQHGVLIPRPCGAPGRGCGGSCQGALFPCDTRICPAGEKCLLPPQSCPESPAFALSCGGGEQPVKAAWGAVDPRAGL